VRRPLARPARGPGRAAASASLLVLVIGSSPPRAQGAAPATTTPPGAAVAPAAARPGPAATATPSVPAQAGPIQIDVAVDRRTVTIGDPIVVTIRLTRPADVRVVSFEPERSLGDIAILDRRSEGPEKLPDGRLQDTRVLRLARYETGETRIPSFEAAYVDAGGRQGKVGTAPVPISVTTVLAEGDARPADIKNPAVMPERPLWPWLVAAAVLAAAIAIWIRQRWRARPVQAAPAVPPGPPRPAHETAYAELERLLSSGLLEKGQVKQFYIELAEILRRYLTARFGVETFERTTSEILEALRAVRLPVRGMAATADFFAACDMVKFAKYLPGSEETRATVERAYGLIDETKTRQAVAPAPAGALAGGVR